MAKLIYRNVPYNTSAGVGIVILTDDMAPSIRQQWLDALKDFTPDPQPFFPTFLLAFGLDSITGMKWQLNPHWFADQTTADWIAAKFGNGSMRQVDILGPGPFSVDKKAVEFELADGRWINAGIIASYYENNPEDQFPGVAEKLIRGVLGL